MNLKPSQATFSEFTIPEEYRKYKLFLVSWRAHKSGIFDDAVTSLLTNDNTDGADEFAGYINSPTERNYININNYVVKPNPNSMDKSIRILKIIAFL